jgi:hypothetical protein
MNRRHSVGVLLAVTTVALLGCGGGEQELRSASQAKTFIEDLARGKNVDWRLGEDAAVVSRTAWQNQTRIQRLGTKLREEGSEWACNAAEQVHGAREAADALDIYVPPPTVSTIITTSESRGADPFEANSLVRDALGITDSELVETISAVSDVCTVAEQF